MVRERMYLERSGPIWSVFPGLLAVLILALFGVRGVRGLLFDVRGGDTERARGEPVL